MAASANTDEPTIERALRFLGTKTHGELDELLVYAIDMPEGETGRALRPLVERTTMLTGWSAEERGHALWQVIEEGIHARDVSPTPDARRHYALRAAFQLPVDNIETPWGRSLGARFKQLREGVPAFGKPATNQPIEKAWKQGVEGLARHLEIRFNRLQSEDDWAAYKLARKVNADEYTDDTQYRDPSPGAQPLFVNLLVVTVFIKGRKFVRAITERRITARKKDGPLLYYTAQGFSVGDGPQKKYVPVTALWGCRAEQVEDPQSRRPPTTRLFFHKPLAYGEQALFASEIAYDSDQNDDDSLGWYDVEIDHHGISRGHLLQGWLPVHGLTVRLRFDESDLPEAVWWYAEIHDAERYDCPPEGDRRRVLLAGCDAQHTFTKSGCQPRELYGLGFSWATP